MVGGSGAGGSKLRSLRLAALVVAVLAAWVLPAQPAPGTVRVAAAADLRWALEEVRGAFERSRPGTTVAVTFGSSGNFFAQLQQQAPFDVFLSADADYPRRLAQQGLAEPPFLYARGPLALWVPKSSPLKIEAEGLHALLHPGVRRIAIANPRHAPYGRAAEAALRRAGLLERLQMKLVLGENVSQAAQFAQTGNADAGIIALSLAMSAVMQERGRSWRIPADLHPPLDQGGAVLSRAQDPVAARAFRDFLAGAEAAAILARHGFLRPGD